MATLWSNCLSAENAADPVDVVIQITNIEKPVGSLRLAIYADETTYLNNAYESMKAKATGDTQTLVFKNIPRGVFAVSVHHDVNDNDQFDTGLFGRPIEPYGFSNNARGTFGPAKWEDAKFEVTGQIKTISIELR